VKALGGGWVGFERTASASPATVVKTEKP
jgi:hypothetical protein